MIAHNLLRAISILEIKGPNTRLLIRAEKPDGSTIFTDSSSHGKAVTASNAIHSTTTAKFGNSSIYFNGGAYLRLAASPDWNFGSSDFTIDFWAKRTNTSGGNGTLVDMYYSV